MSDFSSLNNIIYIYIYIYIYICVWFLNQTKHGKNKIKKLYEALQCYISIIIIIIFILSIFSTLKKKNCLN